MQSSLYNLTLADNRYDKYLTANKLLNRRLAIVRNPDVDTIEKSHILFVRKIYKPFVDYAEEYTKIIPNINTLVSIGSKGNITFNYINVSHFTSDMVLRVKLPRINVGNKYCKYVDYPGIRLLEAVKFMQSETVIDEYDINNVLFINNFEISENRRRSWDRCMGQQTLRETEYFNSNMHTGVYYYKNGLQTLKHIHEETELFIPLQFWFCKDISTALLNSMIGISQKQISITLCDLNDLIECYDESFKKIDLPFRTLQPDFELYVNSINIPLNVYNIFTQTSEMTFIKSRQTIKKMVKNNSGTISLSGFTYPSESLYVGIQYIDNNISKWNLFGKKKINSNDRKIFIPNAIWNTEMNMVEFTCKEVEEFYTYENIVNNIKIQSANIDIYPSLSSKFYNAYMPQKHAKSGFVSPRDTSMWVIPFSAYPGTQQPSGYYNFSTSDVVDLSYNSNSISEDTPAFIHIISNCIKILIANNGSLAIRYT